MAKYQTDFPPFGVTADILVFTLRDDQHDMEVLLIERAGEPFEGMWAIPGGFIDKDGKDKSIQDTAYRELEEETGIRKKDGDLLQLGAYWTKGRDPRSEGPNPYEVASVAFIHIGPESRLPKGGSDAKRAQWIPVGEALAKNKKLAFDHKVILKDGVDRARQMIEDVRVATKFLPKEFTARQLRAVYEKVWGAEIVGDKGLDPGNFQRRVGKMVTAGVLRESDAREIDPGTGRTAKLYSLAPSAKGFSEFASAIRIEAPTRRS